MIFDKYPYTNFHEMNDDWVIQTLREFGQRLDEFVAANQLTYADPIEYDPATPYPANTVVVYNDTAYVSKQAVPAGMLPAADSDYWLLIFPFGDLINGAVEDMQAQVDAALAAANEQLQAAIDGLPATVDAWMTAHPDVTTTVPLYSINWQKLSGEMQAVILADYIKAPEGQEIIFTEQGGLYNGAEYETPAYCRTGFLHFPVGIVRFVCMTGYLVRIYRYDDDGTFINYTDLGYGTTQSTIGDTAIAVAADEQYRLTITIDGGTNLAPADIPLGTVLYNSCKPVYMRDQQNVLANLEAVGNTSGTVNKNIGSVIASGSVCTFEITASQANASQDISIYWRSPSGNLNRIGVLPRGETHAVFTDVSPNGNATLIRLNNAVEGATYQILITTNTQVNAIDDLEYKYAGIGDKTPIADVLSFTNGYWQNANTFSTTTQYRVGAAAYTFDKDVMISAYNGYQIGGYVDGVSIGTVGQVMIPKYMNAKLYIRKVWEDQSTPVTVAEMTDNVFILNLNKLTEYERLTDSFAGLEMFRTVGFIGDSYTATRLGLSWVDIVQQRTGVSCTKFAKSGDDSGAWLTDNANGLPALTADTAKDAYWIALGINDGDRVDANASYLGTINDISGSYESYPDTFYGNYGHIIEAVQEHAPNAKIVLYKPIYRSQSRTLWGVSATQNGLKLVRDAIDVIAVHYGLPVIDALDDVMFRSTWYTKHMDSAVSAGTHPAVMLYPAIAAANMRLFSRAVQKYDTYFMDLRYD